MVEGSRLDSSPSTAGRTSAQPFPTPNLRRGGILPEEMLATTPGTAKLSHLFCSPILLRHLNPFPSLSCLLQLTRLLCQSSLILFYSRLFTPTSIRHNGRSSRRDPRRSPRVLQGRRAVHQPLPEAYEIPHTTLMCLFTNASRFP